jgi:carboxypeptidase D
MKLSTFVGGFVCASTALAASSPLKLDVFKKAKPVLERRVANAPFAHPEIQKRASRFMSSKSEG